MLRARELLSKAAVTFIAMNRFKVRKGEEPAFETRWRERDTHLHTVPGFIEFHLLKGRTRRPCALCIAHDLAIARRFRNRTLGRAFVLRETTPNGQMARILLVEDDVDVRAVMEHILIDAGYEVDAAGSEGGALDLLWCRRYDLVIADAKLPDGTGMTVAGEAHENGIKSLIVTGYAFSLPHGTIDRYDILLKPLRPNELLDVVARHLEGS